MAAAEIVIIDKNQGYQSVFEKSFPQSVRSGLDGKRCDQNLTFPDDKIHIKFVRNVVVSLLINLNYGIVELY